MRRRIIAILPLLAAVAATRLLGSMVIHIFDDAFITFRYAKNLAITGDFVYNAGEWVLGTTAPAFGLLSALFYALTLPMPATVLVLNICIDVAIAYLLYQLVSEAFSDSAALLVVLFFAVSPILVRISVGGMEANLFVLLIVSSLILYRRGHIGISVVVASLSYFVRPEGALLALFLIAGEARHRRFGSAIKYAALSLATVLPGLVIIYLTYGSFIPQSVAAKASNHHSIFEVLRRLIIPEPASIVFLAMALLGIREVLRVTGAVRSFLGFALIYLIGYIIMRPAVFPWYSMPVQTALVVAAGIAGASAIERFSFIAKPLWKRYAPLAGMCGVAGIWVGVYLVKEASGISNNIYDSLSSTTQQLQGLQILATDIGALGYFSNARIYDAAGLVTPQALKHASVEEMIKADHPDALFLTTTRDTREMMDSAYFSNNYEFVRRYGPSGDTGMPSDSEYIMRWQQDYVLFVRRAR